MSTSDRVARRKQATRQRIVDAAMRLFLSQGFEQTSVAQISEAADIGKGTFFTYFAAKQDVLSFLGEQVMAAMTAADDPQATAQQRLRRIFAAAGDWFAQHEDSGRQMCVARLSTLGQGGVASSRGPLLELLASIVAAGVAAGEFRAVDIDAAVTLVASAYFAPVARWTWETDGPALSQRLDAQLELALAALVV